MSALQLQNLATLAAAAAAAQNSASPSTANPLSSNAASLGALASPGNTAATQVGGGLRRQGLGGANACLRPPLCTVTITSVVAPPPMIPGTSPPSLKPSTNHRCRKHDHLHCPAPSSVLSTSVFRPMVCVSTVSTPQTSIFHRDAMLCC